MNEKDAINDVLNILEVEPESEPGRLAAIMQGRLAAIMQLSARDVLKVLKLHSPTARAILRTFKISLVPINHEMHSRSYDFLDILFRLVCTLLFS